ncbi:MAG: hypothetical protein KBT59_00770, partial [Sphingomonadales bacterium]|nr:hypothetical protein [Sphingomonadales bacterium]
MGHAAEQKNSLAGDSYRSTDLVPFRTIRKWLVIFPIIIVILGCLREWLLLGYGVDGTNILSLNREQNVGTWYSTVLIFSCAC